jgi:hypothetical protein
MKWRGIRVSSPEQSFYSQRIHQRLEKRLKREVCIAV